MRLLQCVDTHMLGKVEFEHKGVVTELTCVGLSASVDGHVKFQVRLQGEWSVTLGAPQYLGHVSVDLTVPLVVRFVVERVLTYIATKPLDHKVWISALTMRQMAF